MTRDERRFLKDPDEFVVWTARIGTWAQRNQRALTAAGGVLLLAVVVAGILGWRSARQTEAASEYLNFVLDRYTPAYRAELDHLITAVEQGSQPIPGFADGREALALADAAVESLQTGRRVQLR